MTDRIQRVHFRDVDPDDPFFDSLKDDYPGFGEWFERKSDKKAYVLQSDGRLQAFLYLKPEMGEAVHDVSPSLPKRDYVKIGTLKVNPHGTRLGERFIKRAFDVALHPDVDADAIYVTVFPKHKGLVSLFERYGFKKVATKDVNGNAEDVMLRNLRTDNGELLKNYPLIKTEGERKYLLGIYPRWHTELLPDSKLHNENKGIISDQSHTNSIHKIYICKMYSAEELARGDVLVIYRTSDKQAPAEYRSVATSVCVVEDLKTRSDFEDISDYLEYCEPYSVFNEAELRTWWREWRRLIVIRFTYNAPLRNRVIRKDLIESAGMNRKGYWGFRRIADDSFHRILELGNVNERYLLH